MRLSRPNVLLPFVFLAAIACASCVERIRELTAAERAQLDEYIGTTAPRPQHRLSVRFGDKVELIGYDAPTTPWVVGQKLTFTWYWHALADVDEGYRAFTHLGDGTGARRFGADDEGIVRHLYPVGRFRRGEYIRDVQEITLPANFDAPEVAIYLGIFRDEERMPVTRGANDGDQRTRVVTIPVDGRGLRAAPTLARLRVGRASAPPALDGRLVEPEWQRATPTPAFVETMSGAELPFNVTARALWDDTNLYIAFEVEDTFLSSPFRSADDHLWEKDCVEIMLDPGGDSTNYFELQANPIGTVFDTRYDRPRNPGPFGHVDWNSGMRVGVATEGTPNDANDDRRYVVETAIPWTAFATGTPPATKPNVGDTWRANFYVMDAMRAGMRYAAWSPPRVGDFHVPDRFGTLSFEGPR